MNKIRAALQILIKTTNWDGLRCIIMGNPGIREITNALKRQREIDDAK